MSPSLRRALESTPGRIKLGSPGHSPTAVMPRVLWVKIPHTTGKEIISWLISRATRLRDPGLRCTERHLQFLQVNKKNLNIHLCWCAHIQVSSFNLCRKRLKNCVNQCSVVTVQEIINIFLICCLIMHP